MRFLASLFVVLAAALLQSAFSASLQSVEKEKVHHDALTELKKIDQLEFEAAQKDEAAQLNVTEKQSEDARYLGAATDESGKNSNITNKSCARLICITDVVSTVEAHSVESVGDVTVEVYSEVQSDAAEGGRNSSDAAASEKGANCPSSEEMVADEPQQSSARPDSTSEDDRKDSTKEQVA
ncbi:uncharacterized protein ACBT44_018604 isoform 2-T2 [Syngnathus typhle]